MKKLGACQLDVVTTQEAGPELRLTLADIILTLTSDCQSWCSLSGPEKMTFNPFINLVGKCRGRKTFEVLHAPYRTLSNALKKVEN